MKEIILILALTFSFAACSAPPNPTELQNKVKQLEKQLQNVYTPGFGKIMSTIQVHHAKLWFAGSNNNWALAKFEIHEIEEGLEDIEKYQGDRAESELIGMIKPALDTVSQAIQNSNSRQFQSGYSLLTETCNQCHKSTKHPFVKIIIPSTPPFSNQGF